MGNPYVREIGRVEDIDGLPLAVGVEDGTVTIGLLAETRNLIAEQADEPAALLITALWQAERDAGRMAAHQPDDCRDAAMAHAREEAAGG